MIDLTPYAVPAEQAGWRLDAVVRAWLTRELATTMSKAAVRKLIMAGAIRLDGRPTRRAGALLPAGSRLEARVEPASISSRGLGRPVFDAASLTVLYEDDDVIAVAKPPGLPMHATADSARPDCFSLVRRLIAQRPPVRQGGAAPYLGLHHRLDVDTSGVVLFTKREAANAGVAAQFAAGAVEKVYHALVAKPASRAPRAWHVEGGLAPSGTGGRSRMKSVESGGVRAATSFQLVRASRLAWLVEARPETGRKHQIRAHLAGGGMSILGDPRYGGPTRLAGCRLSRPMLHACRLALAHPLTGLRLSIACPYPPDFRDALRCLFSGPPATIPGR